MALPQHSIPGELLNDADVSPTESTIIHPYPGSMPAYLAARLCDRYSRNGDTIFDPFCGSGSVLVEAARQGRNVLGTDLLDIPVSIARSALSLPSSSSITSAWRVVHVNALRRASLFSEDAKEQDFRIHRIGDLRNWLHTMSFRDVVALDNEIRCIEDESMSSLFLLMLAGLLPSLSKRASRGVLHWGWIADNVVPQRDDLLRTDPFLEMSNRVERLTRFLDATGAHASKGAYQYEVTTHDWLTGAIPAVFSATKVDAIITSPPYPYSIDYSLALRLSTYFLGSNHFGARNNEIGARYKRKRKQRGIQYLSELRASLNCASSLVISGGRAVFVLPDPAEYRKVLDMDTDQWISFLCDSLNGDWTATDYGFRKCTKRRLVHSSRLERRELIASFTKS